MYETPPAIPGPTPHAQRGPKIALSGKGGVGKTTLAAALAHLAAREGHRVLAVDADPAASLGAALGLSWEQRQRIVPVAQHRALIEARTGARVREYGQVFKLNPDVSDIPETLAVSVGAIRLLVLGAIEGGGSGCACPESAILRGLLTDVVLFRQDCVIVDFEAGLEHLGRATAQGVDLMLVVVQPGVRSVEVGERVQAMAREIGIPRIAVIGNQVAGAEDQAFLRRKIAPEDYLGEIPDTETVRQAEKEHRPWLELAGPLLEARLLQLWHAILARATS